jgi:F0F1-type ATP synthase assembly protein I
MEGVVIFITGIVIGTLIGVLARDYTETHPY